MRQSSSEKLEMNKDSILGYVQIYKSILNQYKIFLSEQDLSNIYQLILLVFELDDLYDLAVSQSPNPTKLVQLERAMISLMPNSNPIGLEAISRIFRAMKDESLLKADRSLNLARYLKISSQSIGALIIMAYLASKIKVAPDIWYSATMIKFNNEINILIRLANDYLDTDKELSRSKAEIPQIKASYFFNSKPQFKRYLLCRYLVHKLHYYFYQIRFKYRQLSTKNKECLQAIACSESVLDWAFKVYVIDRNSCQ